MRHVKLEVEYEDDRSEISPEEKYRDSAGFDFTLLAFLSFLLLTPTAAYTHFSKFDAWGRFVLNYVAIIPMACMLAHATHNLAYYLGENAGAILIATTGNAPQLIFSYVALKRNEVELVQTGLVGSMLTSLLLVIGLSLFIGGFSRKDTHTFNATIITANTTILMVAFMAVCLPTIYISLVPSTHNDLQMSYIASFALLSVYCQFMYFALRTHEHLFITHGPRAGLKPSPALFYIVAYAVAVFIHSEFLVSAALELTRKKVIGERFAGAVVLPLASNSAEMIIALQATRRGRFPLAIRIAFASCTQIAAFIAPMLVLVGWNIGIKMDLSFQIFEVVGLHISIVLVAEVLRSGAGTWFQGAMLLTTYALLAFGFHYYPSDGPPEPPSPL